MQVELEAGGLQDSLGVGQRAGHAAEDLLVHLDQLVDGLRRHQLPEDRGGGVNTTTRRKGRG